MIRRFNYTDRVDLKPSMFHIVVREGPPRTFEADWDLQGHPMPADGRVYVEATASGSPLVLRFPFGSVSDRQPPASGTDLSELPGDGLQFTVKIVDETDPRQIGRLVGLAESIRPKAPGDEGPCGRQSILPVQPVEMGERVWRVRYEHNRPYLQVNKNVPDILHTVQNDTRFFALVFPEIVRQVLHRALVVDGHYQVTNEENDWKDQWLRFAIPWHPDQAPPPEDLADPLDDDGRQQLDDWIEAAVHGFCAKKGTAYLLITADEEAAQ